MQQRHRSIARQVGRQVGWLFRMRRSVFFVMQAFKHQIVWQLLLKALAASVDDDDDDDDDAADDDDDEEDITFLYGR